MLEGVAVLMLALTLAMPLLCMAHCQITAGLDQPDPALTGDQAHFLCNLTPQHAGADLFVPAFWPAWPAALYAPLLALPLLSRQRLLCQLPAPLAGWAPRSPPPR
jgi:hypothetical protein